MKLSELYRQLAYGELTNLSMANAGAIVQSEQPKIVIQVNEGLLRLHSRFILKEKDLLLEQVSGITNYHLTAAHAESTYLTANASQLDADDDVDPDPNAPPVLANWDSYPYIKDLLGEPFEEDVIKILAVHDGHLYGSAYGSPWTNQYTSTYDSVGVVKDMDYPFQWGIRGDNYSNTLPLNDSEDLFSLFTPQANVLQVPHPKHGKALGVLYQAGHKTIVDNDLNQQIHLPKVLEGALKAFVAYGIFNNMNGQENKMAAQDHLARYEAICGDVIDKDLVSSSLSTTNVRFRKRGFV